jgi:hypothetical protein
MAYIMSFSPLFTTYHCELVVVRGDRVPYRRDTALSKYPIRSLRDKNGHTKTESVPNPSLETHGKPLFYRMSNAPKRYLGQCQQNRKCPRNLSFDCPHPHLLMKTCRTTPSTIGTTAQGEHTQDDKKYSIDQRTYKTVWAWEF